MCNVMNKLDGLADNERARFEQKLQQEKKRQDKLRELIEIEKYEWQQRFAAEKAKRQRALRKVDKTDKEIEKKQLLDYKQYLRQRKELEAEQQRQFQHLTKLELHEAQARLRRAQAKELAMKEQEEIERQKSQRHLQQITERILQKNERQSQSLAHIAKSRNSYFERVKRIRTEFKERSALQELEKAYRDLQKYGLVVEKGLRVEADRREYAEQLQRLNQERLARFRQLHLQQKKQRDFWSVSVLQKHQQE